MATIDMLPLHLQLPQSTDANRSTSGDARTSSEASTGGLALRRFPAYGASEDARTSSEASTGGLALRRFPAYGASEDARTSSEASTGGLALRRFPAYGASDDSNTRASSPAASGTTAASAAPRNGLSLRRFTPVAAASRQSISLSDSDNFSSSYSSGSSLGDVGNRFVAPRKFSLGIVPMNDDVATRYLATKLDQAAALPAAEQREAYQKVLQRTLGAQGAALSPNAREQLVAFVRQHAGRYIAGLQILLDRCVVLPMVDDLAATLAKLSEFAQGHGLSGQDAESLQRLVAAVADKRTLMLQPRAAEVGFARAKPRAMSQSALLLGQLERLGSREGSKQRVKSLPNVTELTRAHGEQVRQASYYHLGDKTIRAGKTVAAGGFSKIRNFVDQDGSVGKLRVLHLHEQRSLSPNRPMHVSDVKDVFAELNAVHVSGSPIFSQGVFHVVHKQTPLTVKVYLPMPDLGVDTFDLAGRLPTDAQPSEAAAALRTMADAALDRLIPLHEAGMVHRDIKPENLTVDATGNVELIDFGLTAKLPLSRSRGAAGTPGLIAPEYLAGEHAHLDGRLDVWGLGATLLWAAAPLAASQFPTYQFGRARSQAGEAAALTEQWYQASFGGGEMPEVGGEGGEEAAAGLRALDEAKNVTMALDPDFTKLLFGRVFRMPPNERLTAEGFRQALHALPALAPTGEKGRRMTLQEQQQVGRETLARAFAQTQRAQARIATEAGPSLAQLAALPKTPNS